MWEFLDSQFVVKAVAKKIQSAPWRAFGLPAQRRGVSPLNLGQGARKSCRSLGPVSPKDGPAKTLEKLQREAKKRWKAEEGALARPIVYIYIVYIYVTCHHIYICLDTIFA